MTNSAAHKPTELVPQFQGETRTAHGYQFWTTSEEDEEAVTKREQMADDEVNPKPKKKKQRKKVLAKGAGRRLIFRFVGLLTLLAFVVLGYLVFNFMQIRGAIEDNTQPADAAVVLGAAQFDGSPSYVLSERLDHALNLYNDGVVDKIITTGAGAEGDRTNEGLVGFEHLRSRDVPADDIIVIPEGANTWQQLSATAFQMEENEFEMVLLVSDSYHNYRLLDIADELGINAAVSPSAVTPSIGNYVRESVAVGIGRITDYRRLSNFTDNS